MAQELFVVSCYNGKNGSGYQFEVTEEDRRVLDALVKTITPSPVEGQEMKHIVPESVFYSVCDGDLKDLMFTTYESVKFSGNDNECIDGTIASVFPVTQDEFWKTYKNPFRNQNERRVLRLDAGDDIVELVSKYNIGEYLVRYIRKPNAIVLVDMPDWSDLTVFNGNSTAQPCELDETVHSKIVELAVNMALRRKSIGNTK